MNFARLRTFIAFIIRAGLLLLDVTSHAFVTGVDLPTCSTASGPRTARAKRSEQCAVARLFSAREHVSPCDLRLVMGGPAS